MRYIPANAPAILFNQRKLPMGRRQRHDVDVIRTVAWCAGVVQASGLTLQKLNELFKSKERSSENTDWYRYHSGSRVPTDRAGKNDFVTQVDASFKGTAHIFRHYLWRLLKYDRPSESLLLSEIALLSLPVQEILIQELPGIVGRPRPMRKLVSLASLDALAAVVWLTHYAKATVDEPLVGTAYLTFLRLTRTASVIPQLVGQFVSLGLFKTTPIFLESKVGRVHCFAGGNQKVPLHEALFDLIAMVLGHDEYVSPMVKIPMSSYWRISQILYKADGDDQEFKLPAPTKESSRQRKKSGRKTPKK